MIKLKKNLNSLFEGFYRLSIEERVNRVQEIAELSADDVKGIRDGTSLSAEIGDGLIENFIGYFQLPMGVATYFNIDGRDLLIPMVVEETSIIAAASSTAKWIRNYGAIRTELRGGLIVGQIQFAQPKNPQMLEKLLQDNKTVLIHSANQFVPNLVKRGGGIRDISIRRLDRPDNSGQMLVMHLLCDPCDAMGANLINQVCEQLKPIIEALTQEKVGMCILSNLVDQKLAMAEVELVGLDPVLCEAIQEASFFAEADPYRATTHNKGILNGIDPILIATGNDWRAVEAGAHAYASRSGKYQPLATWRAVAPGKLVGRIELPMALGIVGGVTQIHPLAKMSLKMMKINKAEDLARVCAAVGLVQNLGALKALKTKGIVKGHMSLHASNLAVAADAKSHEISSVQSGLIQYLEKNGKITVSDAKLCLARVRGNKSEYYQEFLEKVSRSFSFCIKKLEEPLREWIGLSYLLFRVLDTIEDAVWLDKGSQIKHIESFISFLDKVPNQEELKSWIKKVPKEGVSDAEIWLLSDLDLLLEDIHLLPSHIKKMMFEALASMARGMIYFLSKNSNESALGSVIETNRYCFFVAGLVGELLTCLSSEVLTAFKMDGELLRLSHHFGLFLQKINILKDQRVDEQAGRLFVSSRENLLESVRQNANAGFEYICSIPIQDKGYKTFCSWSFFLGLASLPYIERSWQLGLEQKIPREETQSLMIRVAQSIHDNESLKKLYEEYLPANSSAQEVSGIDKDFDLDWETSFEMLYLRKLPQEHWRDLGLI